MKENKEQKNLTSIKLAKFSIIKSSDLANLRGGIKVTPTKTLGPYGSSDKD